MSFPNTMQAITIAKTGDVDVIERTEVPFPEAKPSEIIIKVAYGGVNFIDIYFRSGLYPVGQFPAVLGMEVSGTIVRLPTDESVLNDKDFKRRGYKVGSKVAATKLGLFSEYAAVPWISTYVVPDNVPLSDAAGGTISGLTALTFVTEAYNVKRGDTVFVHTIAGALGLTIVQLVKMRGATVVGTTSTKEKAELAKSFGADHVILYKEEDVKKRVEEITGGQGVDVVYDGLGKDTFELDFDLLKRKGTLVSCGNTTGPIPPFPPLKLVGKNIKLVRPSMSNYVVTPEESYTYGTQLFKYISDGKLKFNIHSTYEFTAEDVRRAQTDLLGGSRAGKGIIRFQESAPPAKSDCPVSRLFGSST